MPVKLRLKHSATVGKQPLPADLLEGELALNINSASPAAYIKDSTGVIRQIAGISVSGTAPATPTAGMAWLDTSVSARPTFKIHDGATWQAAVSGFTIGNVAPTAPPAGNIWVDTTTPTAPVLKIYNGTAFVTVTPDATVTSKGIVQLADATAITAGTAGLVVDAAQLKANVPPDATTTKKGVVQLADATAITAGTVGRIVDAAQLKASYPPDATTTKKGVVQLADAAAITAGTAGLVVDAAQLKANVPADATTTKKGIVQLADAAAIIAGTAGLVVDAAQLKANVPADASEIVKGIVELATAAETTTGTDNTRAVHPAGLKQSLGGYIIHSSTAPTTTTHPGLVSGTVWVDLSKTPNVLKIYDAAGAGTWSNVVPAAGAAAAPTVEDPIKINAGAVGLKYSTGLHLDSGELKVYAGSGLGFDGNKLISKPDTSIHSVVSFAPETHEDGTIGQIDEATGFNGPTDRWCYNVSWDAAIPEKANMAVIIWRIRTKLYMYNDDPNNYSPGMAIWVNNAKGSLRVNNRGARLTTAGGVALSLCTVPKHPHSAFAFRIEQIEFNQGSGNIRFECEAGIGQGGMGKARLEMGAWAITVFPFQK